MSETSHDNVSFPDPCMKLHDLGMRLGRTVTHSQTPSTQSGNETGQGIISKSWVLAVLVTRVQPPLAQTESLLKPSGKVGNK